MPLFYIFFAHNKYCEYEQLSLFVSNNQIISNCPQLSAVLDCCNMAKICYMMAPLLSYLLVFFVRNVRGLSAEEVTWIDVGGAVLGSKKLQRNKKHRDVHQTPYYRGTPVFQQPFTKRC